MSERHRYQNPPIEEALCEFHFRPGQDRNLTIPGKLQTKLGDEYTGKPQEQRVVQVGLESQGGEPPNLRYGEGLGRVLLATKDDKRRQKTTKEGLESDRIYSVFTYCVLTNILTLTAIPGGRSSNLVSHRHWTPIGVWLNQWEYAGSVFAT